MPPAPGEVASPEGDDAAPNRRVVLVAGAGRSGTSTFAGILQLLGLHVPQPEVAADESNPRGFAESQWVVDFHNELLQRAQVQPADARPQAWKQTAKVAALKPVQDRGHRWLTRHLGAHDELVVKDPRLSWFLPLWREAATRAGATPCFATLLRSPTEVMGSRKASYGPGLGPTQGVAGWVNMLLHTELATRGGTRVFIRYDDLLADWQGPVRQAGRSFGLAGVTTAPDATIARVDDFVDPNLRRVALTWDDVDVPVRLREVAEATWSELNTLVLPDGDTSGTEARLDELRLEYARLYGEAESLARSSIYAARLFSRPEPPKPADTATPSSPPTQEQAQRRGVADRLAGRVPHAVRRRVPASARTRVRRLLRLTTRSRP